jgi:hypothetical protein
VPRAPLGHAGGVPTIRVTRPNTANRREPVICYAPGLLPQPVRGRTAAQRRLTSHHHLARARLRRRLPGRAARPRGSRARRGCSCRCRLSAGFPHGLSCCWLRAGPLPVADPAGELVDGAGAGPLDAAASLGYRRHRPRREEYRVQAAVLARRRQADRAIPEVRTPRTHRVRGTARNVIRGGVGHRGRLRGPAGRGASAVCWGEDG